MALKVYKDSACTQPIQTEVGKLSGDGSTTSFTCTGNPAEVRKFSTSAPYGQLLSEGTDYSVTDNGDGTYTVTLTTAPASGETVVAFDSGEKVFADQYAIGNSASESDRTFEQQLFVKAEDVNAQNVTVAIEDYVSGAGADTSWFYLAPDSSGSPGTYGSAGASLDIGNMNSGDVVPFWVKCIVPQGTDMENYRDVYLKVSGLEFSTN